SARAVSTVKRSSTKIEGTTPTLTPDIFTSLKARAVLDPIVIKNHRIPFTKPLNRCSILNMSSIRRAPHTAPETAERIRDAAISEFPADGVANTALRNVAAAAEVSAGLVIHHYGSKDGLRPACDDHAFDSITETTRSQAAAPQSELFAMLTQGAMHE